MGNLQGRKGCFPPPAPTFLVNRITPAHASVSATHHSLRSILRTPPSLFFHWGLLKQQGSQDCWWKRGFFYCRAIKRKKSSLRHCLLQAFKGTCPTLKFRKNGICFVLQHWTTDKRLFVPLGLLKHLFPHHSILHSAPLFIPVCPSDGFLQQTALAAPPPTPALIWHPALSRGCGQDTVAPHALSYAYVRHLLWGAQGTRTLSAGGGVRASESIQCQPDILALTLS